MGNQLKYLWCREATIGSGRKSVKRGGTHAMHPPFTVPSIHIVAFHNIFDSTPPKGMDKQGKSIAWKQEWPTTTNSLYLR